MIGYIKGPVVEKGEKSVIISISGLGYEVLLPKKILEICKEGEEKEVWIHTNVKEDSITLFGFGSRIEKEFFQKLIGISGIGPRTALEIVDTPRETITTAINTGNHGILATIPGIGKKTAEKLLPDLRSIFDKSGIAFEEKLGNMNKFSIDMIGALENLGFKKDDAIRALKNVPEEIDSDEEILRYALKEMRK